jgi:hypothetical protein
MLRLTIPKGEGTAFIVMPFSALSAAETTLESDDEANMRAAFVNQAFRLNTRLSPRISLLGADEILFVTPAMLRK